MASTELRPWPYVWGLMKGHPGWAIQSGVLLILMAVVNLPLPFLNKLAIDHAIPAGDTMPLILLGVLAFAVRGIASGFQVVQNYVVRRLTADVGHQLRQGMIASLLRAPYARYLDGEVGGYVGRLSTDARAIEEIIFDTFRFILRPLAMILVMVLVMGLISWIATVVIMIITPTAVILTRGLARDLRERQRHILDQRQHLQSSVTEVLDNIRVIRAYVREDRFRTRIGNQVRTYTDASVAHATRRQATQGIIDLLGLIPWVVLVAVGGWLVRSGSITIGDFMLFITFEQLLRSPVGQLTYYLQHIKGEMAAPERVEEVIHLDREAGIEASASNAPERLAGRIDLEDVHFSYPGTDKPVLRGMNLNIAQGERVAVVGPSGAGKTTLFSLLLGFHVPQSGRIAIDDIALTDWPAPELRRRLGVVFQHNPFFDGTIRANLVLDRAEDHPDDTKLWWALEQADCKDFVTGLPDGLQTEIGIRGLKLSGGQRQRLAIARAILRDPAVVLLDEATASLDSLSETQIQRALDRLLQGRTSLTIAHRLSTVVASDRIIYVDQGRIVDQGTHAELIARQGPYHELFKAQTDGLLP